MIYLEVLSSVHFGKQFWALKFIWMVCFCPFGYWTNWESLLVMSDLWGRLLQTGAYGCSKGSGKSWMIWLEVLRSIHSCNVPKRIVRLYEFGGKIRVFSFFFFFLFFFFQLMQQEIFLTAVPFFFSVFVFFPRYAHHLVILNLEFKQRSYLKRQSISREHFMAHTLMHF